MSRSAKTVRIPQFLLTSGASLCRGSRKCLYAEQLANDPAWRPPTMTTRGRQQRTTRPRETPVETQHATEERPKRRRVSQKNSYELDDNALRDRSARAAELREGRRALTTAPRRKKRHNSVLTDVPEDEHLDEATQLRAERQAAIDRVAELEQEKAALEQEKAVLEQEKAVLEEQLEEKKEDIKLGFGLDYTPTKEDMESYTCEDAQEDFDADDDAKADEEMADEWGTVE